MTDTVDVATAARLLGVTPDAVRGRLQRGSMPGEKSASGQWRVPVEALPDTSPQPEPTGQRQDDIEAAYQAHLATLERTVETLESRVESLERALERQQSLTATALDRVPQLPSPDDDTNGDDGDDRPLWRRLLPG